MRRVISLLVVLGALAPLGPATATPEPFVYADAGQYAVADWLLIREHRALNFLVAAARGATAEDGPGAEAIVAKLPCDVERYRRYLVVECRGRVGYRAIAPDQFQMDPLLRTASLTVRSRGRTHRIEWRGVRDQALPETGTATGAVYAGAAVGAAMPAAARGRVFGRSLRYTRDDWAFLDQGGVALAEIYLDDLRMRPDGSLEIVRRFRVPAR